jgi:hypothetical protein
MFSKKKKKKKQNSKELMLGLAYLMSVAGQKSVCITKVLRLANPLKVFRGFPWSQSKC